MKGVYFGELVLNVCSALKRDKTSGDWPLGISGGVHPSSGAFIIKRGLRLAGTQGLTSKVTVRR